MKSRFDIRSLLVGAFLGVVIMFTIAAANNRRTSWEYTTVYYNGSHPNVEAVNKLGNEGWELVGCFAGPEAKYPGFIFKRER